MRDPHAEAPGRAAALRVGLVAAAALVGAALLPAFRLFGPVRPVDGLVELDLVFLLAPHVYGALALAACGLLLWRCERRWRGLEVALVAWAVLAWAALFLVLALGAPRPLGPGVAVLTLYLPASLFARAQEPRWRAVRAVWIGAAECVIYYLFWFTLASVGDAQGGDGDVLGAGAYVGAGASVLLLAAGRRLESLTPRWRRDR